LGDEFGVDEKKLAQVRGEVGNSARSGIMNEAPPGPDRMTVSD
jgi:hypothetical protein